MSGMKSLGGVSEASYKASTSVNSCELSEEAKEHSGVGAELC